MALLALRLVEELANSHNSESANVGRLPLFLLVTQPVRIISCISQLTVLIVSLSDFLPKVNSPVSISVRRQLFSGHLIVLLVHVN